MIYGICGPAESGKSTVALELKDVVEIRDEGKTVLLMSFAFPIKSSLQTAFDWGLDQWEDRKWKESFDQRTGLIPREVAQKLGDIGRPDAWIRLAEIEIDKAYAASKGVDLVVVFTDVRYENEAAWIRSKGGKIIGRPHRESTTAASGHQSETECVRIVPDIIVPWVDDVNDLYAAVRDAINSKPLLWAPDRIELWADYVDLTKATAINMTEKHAKYGLYEEIGEVFGKLKRIERGDITKEEAREAILDELGDVCWYLAQIDPEVCVGGNFTLLNRTAPGWFVPDIITDLADEKWRYLLADLASLANVHGATLQEVCERNIRKTYDRWNRNQTKGQGDKR